MLKICYMGLENAHIMYLIGASKCYSKIEKSRKEERKKGMTTVCPFPPP